MFNWSCSFLYVALWFGRLPTSDTALDLALVVIGTPFVFAILLAGGILGQVPRRMRGIAFIAAMASNLLTLLCLIWSTLWLTVQVLFAMS